MRGCGICFCSGAELGCAVGGSSEGAIELPVADRDHDAYGCWRFRWRCAHHRSRVHLECLGRECWMELSQRSRHAPRLGQLPGPLSQHHGTYLHANRLVTSWRVRHHGPCPRTLSTLTQRAERFAPIVFRDRVQRSCSEIVFRDRVQKVALRRLQGFRK